MSLAAAQRNVQLVRFIKKSHLKLSEDISRKAFISYVSLKRPHIYLHNVGSLQMVSAVGAYKIFSP